MDKDQVKIQFKDKTAVIKWTENDLNVSFGEDKANIKLDGSAIALSQGKDKTKVTIQESYVEVKGASECSCGVDGRWVYINNGRVNLGVSGPKEAATNRVMTDAGPSQVVWAKIS
ncbi:hypothetical protein QIH80_22975 [Bradyrhizobium elkanii]|nr:hypothetical protein QIH80_22975 [Bradyrhizobium elkanii]